MRLFATESPLGHKLTAHLVVLPVREPGMCKKFSCWLDLGRRATASAPKNSVRLGAEKKHYLLVVSQLVIQIEEN